MPTISTPPSIQEESYDIVSEIIDGNYHPHLNTDDFNFFLGEILFQNTSCSSSTQVFDPNCLIHNAKSIFKIRILDYLIEKNKLNNIFDYCREYIVYTKHEISEGITKKLLQLESDFLSLYPKKHANQTTIYTENHENTINSYFAFQAETLTIPGFFSTHIEHISGKNAFQYSRILLKNIISTAPNSTQRLITTNQTNLYIFDITKPLTSFVKGAGNLILQLRNKEEPYEDIETQIKDLVRNVEQKLTPTESSTIKYNFISEYHQGYSDIESVCKDLFNSTECYPYIEEVNEQYQRISQGQSPSNSTNPEDVLAQLSFGSPDIRLERLNNFSVTEESTRNNRLSNFLDYFKESISEINKQQQHLSGDFVKNLSSLIIHLKDVFEKNASKPKIINKALSLFLTVLKNPSIDDHSWHIWPVLSACIDEVKNLLETVKKYPASHDIDVNTPIKILSAILNQANKIDTVINDQNQAITTSIKELSQKCLSLTSCDSFLALNQFSKNLGTMGHRLFKNRKISEADSTIKTAQFIIKNATSDVSESQLQGLAWTFLNRYHDGDANKIASDCKKLFNLIDCHEVFVSNETTEPDFIPTTIIPKAITNSTAALATMTSTVPFAVNTTTTVIPVIHQTDNFQETLTFEITTEVIKDIAQNLSSRLPTTAEIGAATGHGFASSLLNILTQGISMWLRSKGYGESKISALSLSLAGGILQASYIATFPLMLFKLNELVAEGNEVEAQAQWEMMTSQMLPAFFTSLTLSTGLQLLNYLSENYLPKQSFLKGLLQTIPTLTSLWCFSQNPILSGIHAATAYGVSAVGLFGFNRCFSKKSRQPSDIETTVEYDAQTNEINCKLLQSLQEEKPDTAPKEKYNIIKQDALDKIRQDLVEPIIVLVHLCAVYEKRIITMKDIANSMKKIDSNEPTEFNKRISKDFEDLNTLQKNLNSLDKYRILLGTLDIMNFHPDDYLNKIKSMLIDYMHRIKMDAATIDAEINGYLSVTFENINYTPERLKEISESVKIPGKPDILTSLESLIEFAKEGYEKHNKACGYFDTKKNCITNTDGLCALLRNLDSLINQILDDLKAIGGLETSNNIIEKEDLSANGNKPYLINKEMKYIIQILLPLSRNIAAIGKKHQELMQGDKLSPRTTHHLRNGSASIKNNRRKTIAFYSNSSGSDGEARLSIASSGDSSNSAHSDGYGNTQFNDYNTLEEQNLLLTRLNR